MILLKQLLTFIINKYHYSLLFNQIFPKHAGLFQIRFAVIIFNLFVKIGFNTGMIFLSWLFGLSLESVIPILIKKKQWLLTLGLFVTLYGWNRSQGPFSGRWQIDKRTDATKCIISLAAWSIKKPKLCPHSKGMIHVVTFLWHLCGTVQINACYAWLYELWSCSIPSFRIPYQGRSCGTERWLIATANKLHLLGDFPT